MKKLTPKRFEQLFSAYEKSQLRWVDQCYKKPSQAKKIIEQYIHYELMPQYNGICCRIISYNTNFVNFAFIGEFEGVDTFFYITPQNNYYYKLG